MPNYGGYIGASIAWVLHTLVGNTIGYVMLVGMLIGGFVVVGISISGAVEIVIDRWFRKEEARVRARPERARSVASERRARTAHAAAPAR